jgi:hypothetical protein
MLRRERTVLAAAERAALARAAAVALALRVHRTRRPAADLAMVRQARGNGRDRLDENAEQILEAVEARLTERVLDENLAAIVQLGSARRWSQAGQLARGQINQGSLAAETRQALLDFAEICDRVDALDQLDKALQAAAKGRREEAATLLAKLPLDRLPVRLRPRVASLRYLTELLQACPATRWTRAPDAARLRQLVGDLREPARSVFPETSRDTALAGLLLQDLAVKAFLDGYAEQALALYPALASPRQAGRLLGDLKTLAQGKGEVMTWPGRAALLGREDPPPALEPLVEGRGNGWRAGLRAAEPAGSAPLEKVAGLEKPWRDELAMASANRRPGTDRKAEQALQRVRQRHEALRERNRQEEKLMAELEKRWQRPLVPAERVLVRQLARKGKTTEEIDAAVGPMKLARK